MKKILISLIAAVASVGIVAYGAPSTVASYAAPNLVSEINKALANPTNTTITVDGKSTLNGELEVNNSDVDINMTLSANEIDIAQTNATGQSGIALITVTDARTGSTANDTNEATLKLSAAGTYAVAVNNGDVWIDDNARVGGTLTQVGVATFTAESIHDAGIDADYVTTDAAAGVDTKAAGALMLGAATATSVEIADADVLTDIQGMLSVDQYATFDGAVTAATLNVTGAIVGGGTVDADSYTADAAAGLDVQAAGALKLGVTTATSIDYGSSAVTAHTFTSDGTGTGEIVLPNESIGNAELASGIDAAKLLAASVASAIDGSAITNLTGTASADGTTLNALNLVNCTNLPNAGITSLSAAKLTAATVATAIDGSAVTNLTAANVGAGYSAANLSAASVISAVDLSAGTNITAANVGTVAEGAAITNMMLVSDGAGGFSTNALVMYPFGGGYIVKSSTPQ